MSNVIIGSNRVLNAALRRRLVSDFSDSVHEGATVYFTGGPAYGSQAVREKPATVCSSLGCDLETINICQALGVKKLVYVASSCIYPPSDAPIPESTVLWPLDPASEPAALPRLHAARLCHFHRQQYGCNFVVAVPATVYGPHDDFGEDGHALPALMRRFHRMKLNPNPKYFGRGKGNVRREWIYADDVADALVFIMDHYDGAEPVNIGVGFDVTMEHLVASIQSVVGTRIPVEWEGDYTGVDRKLLSTIKLRNLGWFAQTTLARGLELTYEWFKASGAAGEPEQPS